MIVLPNEDNKLNNILVEEPKNIYDSHTKRS